MNHPSSPSGSYLSKSDRVPGKATSLKSVESGSPVSSERLKSALSVSHHDLSSGRFRIQLYRFLTSHIPIVNACIWTWARLCAAPGVYRVAKAGSAEESKRGEERLARLASGLYANGLGRKVGTVALLPDLFGGLFRDGFFGGFLTVHRDGSGVDRFIPVDPIRITTEERGGKPGLVLDMDRARISLDRPDFYHLPLNNSATEPMGRSILQAVPFVSYVEQQLVDDMRRSSHNAGFHRLHVKIAPPERMVGESDNAYAERINGYFDDTVRMIGACDIDDNPVTWDNVLIEHIGPSGSRDATNSWFMSHRAMIEDICAGTNLAPYLLGYSYGATTTWSAFKFDVVMRQVRSVQAEVAQFLEWMGNVDLALAGIEATCRFQFDNTLAYQARDEVAIQTSRTDNILKLYEAGLIDETVAREKARGLL